MGSPGTEAAAGGGDGPVLSMMSKRLRALRKKYNRIVQMEESLARGKILNKEQEEVLRSKPAVTVLIDEYEKLLHPLASALQEELALAATSAAAPPPSVTEVETSAASIVNEDPDPAVKELVTLLYFGSLFDVKSQSDFASTMLTKTHERGCCLTYDYVTDDAIELLGERDLDEISVLGTLVTSRPAYLEVSHKNALHQCLEHAKLWLQKADQPIHPGATITYAELRKKLNKILALDYFTTPPEMKAPGDVAAAVGKYVAPSQVLISESTVIQTEGVQVLEDEQKEVRVEAEHQVSLVDDVPLETDEPDTVSSVADIASDQQELQKQVFIEEQDQKDTELMEQQFVSRRFYHNQRGGRARGGRGNGDWRGYANGRGGHGSRGGGVGYQNGRGQFHNSSYYPRNYYNPRGRGGRSSGPTAYNNHVAPHGAYIPTKVEVRSSA